MSSPTERHRIESDLARLAAEPGGEAPASFLGAVRARRRAVRARRGSAVILGAIVVVAGVRFIPGPAPGPDEPAIVKAGPTPDDPASRPSTRPAGRATLASLHHLYTQAGGAYDLLAELPAAAPPSATAEPPLRLRDARLMLADGV